MLRGTPQSIEKTVGNESFPFIESGSGRAIKAAMTKIAFVLGQADVEFIVTRAMAKQQTILLVDRDTDFLDWAKNQLQSKTARVLTEESSDDIKQLLFSHSSIF
jgi:hypothetical protein